MGFSISTFSTLFPKRACSTCLLQRDNIQALAPKKAMKNMLFLERELKTSRLKRLSGSCLKAKHQHAQVELLLLDVPKVLLDRPHRQSEMTVTKIRLSTLISYLMKILQIER